MCASCVSFVLLGIQGEIRAIGVCDIGVVRDGGAILPRSRFLRTEICFSSVSKFANFDFGHLETLSESLHLEFVVLDVFVMGVGFSFLATRPWFRDAE